jgi:uncharacterized protein (TIGR00269 family)
MFKRGDKILVAVSGGKDSISLVHALSKLGYDFSGLFIDLEIEEFSEENKKVTTKIFNELGKDLHCIKVSDFGVRIRSIKNKPTCYICGIVKRYLQNYFAVENGFDVVATGHNLTDEASFYLMNLYSGQVQYIVKYSPVLPEREKFARKVKPLFKLTEKETMCYALINNLEVSRATCPYANESTQIKWKNLLYSIEEKISGFSINFVSSVRKLSKLIPDKNGKEKLNFCKICEYPTGLKEICAFCSLKKYFRSR